MSIMSNSIPISDVKKSLGEINEQLGTIKGTAFGDSLDQMEFPFINMGYSGAPTAIFKPGDAIRAKASGIKGVVRSHDTIAGVCNVAWDDEWFGSESLAENSIELIESTPIYAPACTCGCKFVPGFEGLHSVWCDSYKELK